MEHSSMPRFRKFHRCFNSYDLSHYRSLYPPQSPLPRKEEVELFRRYSGGERHLEERLFSQYAWFGVWHAHKASLHSRQEGADFDNLVAAGLLGVLKGIRGVNPELGNRASTYIMYHVHNEVRRELVASRFVHYPVARLRKVLTAKRIESELKGYGREPSLESVADEMGSTVEEVEDLLSSYHDSTVWSVLSVFSEGAYEPVPFDVAGENDDTVDEVYRREVLEVLDSTAKGCLTDREREVLYRRFGAFGHERQTLEVIGGSMGISRERVRQLEVLAKEKMYGALRGSGL